MSEYVTLQRFKTKCTPILLYGIEVFSVTKSQLSSIDFAINNFFTKLLQTSNMDIVNYCQQMFCFDLPSVMLASGTE